jgi:hypothetical protein
MRRDVHHVAAGKDTRVGVSEAAHRCLDELDLMDGLADYVTAHRRGLAKLAAIAEPGLPREAMASYLSHAAAFLIRAAELLLEPAATEIETPAGQRAPSDMSDGNPQAGGEAGSDPVGSAPVRREPVSPPAEPARSRIGEEDQD